MLVLMQLTVLTPFLIKVIRQQRWARVLFLLTPFYLIGLYSYTLIKGEQLPFYQTFFPAWFVFEDPSNVKRISDEFIKEGGKIDFSKLKSRAYMKPLKQVIQAYEQELQRIPPPPKYDIIGFWASMEQSIEDLVEFSSFPFVTSLGCYPHQRKGTRRAFVEGD